MSPGIWFGISIAGFGFVWWNNRCSKAFDQRGAILERLPPMEDPLWLRRDHREAFAIEGGGTI